MRTRRRPGRAGGHGGVAIPDEVKDCLGKLRSLPAMFAGDVAWGQALPSRAAAVGLLEAQLRDFEAAARATLIKATRPQRSRLRQRTGVGAPGRQIQQALAQRQARAAQLHQDVGCLPFVRLSMGGRRLVLSMQELCARSPQALRRVVSNFVKPIHSPSATSQVTPSARHAHATRPRHATARQSAGQTGALAGQTGALAGQTGALAGFGLGFGLGLGLGLGPGPGG